MNDNNMDMRGNPKEDYRKFTNLFMTVIDGPATTLRIFWRYRIGIEQPGKSGLVGLLVMLFFAFKSSELNPTPMLAFIGLYLLVCVLRRSAARWREAHDQGEHSWFQGYSYVSRWFLSISDGLARRYIEPLATIVIGVLLGPLSPLLTMYLMLAAFCLLLVEHARYGAEKRRMRHMRDRYIQQKHTIQAHRAYLKQQNWN